MKFKQVIQETTLWTHGGGGKTVYDPKRHTFAHDKLKGDATDTVHYKDYMKTLKGKKKQYLSWVNNIKVKI